MKRNGLKVITAGLVVAAVLGACNLLGNTAERTYPEWESTKTILDLSDTSARSLGATSRTAGARATSEEISTYSDDTDRMYFRSSDIEFWGVDTVAEIAEMASAGLPDAHDAESGTNMSKTIALPDVPETFVFVSGKTFRFGADEVPTFENKTYNMIRLDVGGGAFTFVVDGNEITPRTSRDDVGAGGINSVMLVDKDFLSAPLFVPANDFSLLRQGNEPTVEIPEQDHQVIELFAQHGWDSESNVDGDIDLNGALFIPLEPAAVTDSDNVMVEFSWEMKESVYQQDAAWYMTDRVQGTCYDFSVRLVAN
jgi:hypothetical protein